MSHHSSSSSHSSITNDITTQNNTKHSTKHPKSNQLNKAFLYLKPIDQKQNDEIYTLLRRKLNNNHIKIIFAYKISSNQIDKENIIDKHFYNIASKALYVLPRDLSKKKRIDSLIFQKEFGESWHKAIRDGRIQNAKECEGFCSIDELYAAWNVADQKKQVVKIGHGCYCGKVTIKTKTFYVINGFYPHLRRSYTTPDTFIRAFIIEWNCNKLSWKDFNSKVIGEDDARNANKDSIRRIIYDHYEKYGIKDPPSKYSTIIHASTSPLEALKNRYNWLGHSITNDEFGKVLLYKGITETEIKEWMKDNRLILLPPDGSEEGCIFDFLRGCDMEECVEKIVDVCDVELRVVGDTGCSCSVM